LLAVLEDVIQFTKKVKNLLTVSMVLKIKGISKNCFRYENVRKFLSLWRRFETAAVVAKATSRTNFELTAKREEFAAVRSKNEFLEVPYRNAPGEEYTFRL
jgi:hypothetical protein